MPSFLESDGSPGHNHVARLSQPRCDGVHEPLAGQGIPGNRSAKVGVDFWHVRVETPSSGLQANFASKKQIANGLQAPGGDEAVQRMAQNPGFSVPPFQDPSGNGEGDSHDEQLHKLSASFAPFPDPSLALRQRLRDLAEEGRSVAGPGGCVIGLLEGNDFVCRAAAGESAPNLGARIQTQDELFVQCTRSRQLQVCQNTLADPRVDAAACRAAGVRSLILVPLVDRHGELIGVLEASSPDSHAFGVSVSERMEAIAHRIVTLLVPAVNQSLNQSADESKPTTPARETPRIPETPPNQAPERLPELPKLRAPRIRPATPLAPLPVVTHIVAASTIPAPNAAAHGPDAIPQTASPQATNQDIVGSLYRLPRQSSQNLMLALGVFAAGAVLAVLLWWVQQEKLRQDALASASTQHEPSQATTTIGSSASENGASSDPKPASTAVAQRDPLSTNSRSKTPPRPTKTDDSSSPSGELVVYEKGKVIYRDGKPINPEVAVPSSGSMTGSVTAPMTAASETERLSATASPREAASPGQNSSLPGALTGGILVHRVNPAYPTEALAARLEGDVVLQGVVGTDGLVRDIHAVSGDSRLVEAAMEAVRHWRYEPFLANGEPVDVLSTLTVHFRLPRAPNQ